MCARFIFIEIYEVGFTFKDTYNISCLCSEKKYNNNIQVEWNNNNNNNRIHVTLQL